MQIAIWDIEASDLEANFGVLLSSAIKPLGKKAIVQYTGRKGSNDRLLAISIRNELEKYDLIITHYGLGFDLGYLNTRLLAYRERPLSPKFHIDTWRIAVRAGIKTHSRRLEALADFLGIKGKTRVDPETWRRAAMDEDPHALKKIIEHNLWDVVVLEQVYERLKPFIKSISRA